MISRDLTCNETMPPLDDGDTKTEMHRARNGKTMTSRPSTGVAKGSADFGPTGSLNHMTTVRDVVTRRFRNSKLNASADPLVNYPKLGGVLTLGGHFDVISQNQHHRHVLLTNSESNGFGPSSANCRQNPMGSPVSASNSSEDGWRHAHLSPSSTSSSISASSSSVAAAGVGALIVPKHLQNATIPLDPNNGTIPTNLAQGHYLHPLASSSTSSVTPVTSSSSSTFLRPFDNNGSTTTYFMKTVSMDESVPTTNIATAAFISPPLSTGTFIEHSHHQLGRSLNSPMQQHSSQWAIHPPTEHSLQQRKNASEVLPGRTLSAAVAGMTLPPTRVQSTHVIQQQQQPPMAPISPQKQAQPAHASPRPGILRSNAATATVRRLTVDRDRPASVSGSFTNDVDESPRKRLRKQHFDNGQTISGKPLVVMKSNDRLGQSASAGPSLTGCWRSSSRSATTGNDGATQQIAPSPDPLPNVSAILGANKVVGGVPTEGKHQPKKRGRPKMNCRTQQLPLVAASNGTTIQNEIVLQKKDNHQTEEQAERVVFEKQPMHRREEESKQQKHKMMLENNHLMTQIVTSKEPKSTKSIIISVDHITESEQKKRRYKKRTPTIDPLTGVKKVRKKGSGRKSKKELVATTEAANSNSVFDTPHGNHWTESMEKLAKSTAVHHSEMNGPNFASGQPMTLIESSVDLMSKTAVERDVINTLCRFKRDKDSRERVAKRELLSSMTPSASAKSPSKHDISQLQPDENEHSQKPSCSYGTSKTGRNQSLPLLADLNKLNVLRLLLRRCERGLNTTDNCHLGESYEEICNFLRAANRSVGAPTKRFDRPSPNLEIPTHLDKQCVARLSADVSCQLFGTFEEFKNAIHSLRLLPVACAYFDASQRLLSSLRTSLRAISLYHALQENKLDAESDQWLFGDGTMGQRNLVSIDTLETEEDDDVEAEREERLSHAFFAHLNNEYDDYVGQHYQDDNGKEDHCNGNLQLKTARQLLLQLDVAQTLSLLLDDVENGSTTATQQHHFVHSQRSSSTTPSNSYGTNMSRSSNNVLSFCFHPTHKHKFPEDLKRIIWTKRSGKKRKRSAFEWDDNEEPLEKMEQYELEEVDHRVYLDTPQQMCSSHLLKCVERIKAEASAECAFLDGITYSVGQRTANNCTFGVNNNSLAATASSSSSSSEFILKSQNTPTTARRKRNNINPKSHQFVFRPQMVGELFKFVTKLDDQTKHSTGENNEEQININEEQRRNDATVTTQQQQKAKWVKADVEEMIANCQWGSAKALAQLRHKHAEIFDGRPTSSSRNTIATDDQQVNCTFRPFESTLRFKFPLKSASRNEQSQFLQHRLNELHEICVTTVGLSRTRADLAHQCADSVYETLEGIGQLASRPKAATTLLKRAASMNATQSSR